MSLATQLWTNKVMRTKQTKNVKAASLYDALVVVVLGDGSGFGFGVSLWVESIMNEPTVYHPLWWQKKCC